MARLIQVDKKAVVPEITTLYNHGEEKSMFCQTSRQKTTDLTYFRFHS